jgi:hypothetical protein
MAGSRAAQVRDFTADPKQWKTTFKRFAGEAVERGYAENFFVLIGWIVCNSRHQGILADAYLLLSLLSDACRRALSDVVAQPADK